MWSFQRVEKPCHSEPVRTLAWESPGFSNLCLLKNGMSLTFWRLPHQPAGWFAMTPNFSDFFYSLNSPVGCCLPLAGQRQLLNLLPEGANVANPSSLVRISDIFLCWIFGRLGRRFRILAVKHIDTSSISQINAWQIHFICYNNLRSVWAAGIAQSVEQLICNQ